MNKKILIRIILIVIAILFFTIYNKERVYANANPVKVYFVYSKINVNSKDLLTVNINLSNYEAVKEIKLRINKLENLEPTITNDGYFDINDNTNFSNILVNEYIQNESMNLHIIKENIEVTNYQNNICSINFLVINDIENVIKMFEENIKLYLFDSKMHLLEYEIKHTEKLNANWKIENNTLEVYSEVPNYSDSFKVVNREKGEYEIIVKQNIDTNVIGIQAITIIVVDKLNYDYLVFNQAIDVVDSLPPIIVCPEIVEIKDTEINNLILEKYIQTSDNYDIIPALNILYYDKDKNLINNIDEFKKYIRGEKTAYIEVFSVDASSNSSDKIMAEFRVLDVSAPNIIIDNDYKDAIYIDDTKIEEFDLNSNFLISDNYDSSPNIIFNFYNNITKEPIDNVIEELKKGTVINCEYYGIDNCNNKTKTNQVLLMVKDITVPTISGIENLTIKDKEVDSYDFLQNIICKDNIDQTPSLNIKYFINDKELSKYEFLSELKKGYNGIIKYVAYDKALNYSEEYIQNITIIDTTAPTITIKDIKENGKYLSLDEIKFEVNDNFYEEVEVYVTLNDYEYKGTKISEVGLYTFKIIAKDASGNESIKELKFNIIEKNITGCSGDIDCYIDNYTTVIVVVTVLMLVSLGTIIFKIVYTIKKRRNNKNKLNITIDTTE